MKTFAILIAAASGVLLGQVKTNVPDVVAGARPAIVERIKIHGKALEGNLGRPLPGARAALLQPDAVVRAGQAMTRCRAGLRAETPPRAPRS